MYFCIESYIHKESMHVGSKVGCTNQACYSQSETFPNSDLWIQKEWNIVLKNYIWRQ